MVGKLRWLLFLSCLGVLGCGGASSLGFNSKAKVVLVAESSNQADDLELIVSPKEASANTSDRCTTYDSADWCDVRFDNFTNIIEFRTNSAASKSPYFVYVRNHSDHRRECRVDVTMDSGSGTNKFFRASVSVSAGSTVYITSIYRNSVDR